MSSPTPSEHLDQARDNRAHAEWLISVKPTDPTALQWATTAAFYSALHGLTAYLLARGWVVRSHTARVQALDDPNSGVPASVLDAYRMLEDLSRGARYELWVFTAQDVRDLLDQELAAIAAFPGM
jgi:hypothetical protein